LARLTRLWWRGTAAPADHTPSTASQGSSAGHDSAKPGPLMRVCLSGIGCGWRTSTRRCAGY
jgi:hypothetical protein